MATLPDPRQIIGLTTNAAPYIEQEQAEGHLYIRQPYELYSGENHDTWRRLYERQAPMWEKYANPHFRKGIANLCMDHERVPKLDDINQFLCPLTGFSAKAVSGYIPAFLFFDCLRNREFPTTITIRDGQHLDYLPEPDIFHDIAGHVPMHTDPDFANTLVRFGDCAHTAAEIVAEIEDETERIRRLTSIIQAMARFFWFTIEFGLMREEAGPQVAEPATQKSTAPQALTHSPSASTLVPTFTGARGRRSAIPGSIKVYGSGLLSSHGEIEYAIESSDVQRYPAQLEWIVNQSFEIDHYQPLLFVVDSFQHLFGMVDELETWMRDGRLNNVAAGKPTIGEADLRSFLSAC